MSQGVDLALGTVQFGLAYGVAGRGGAVPEDEVRIILERAAALGIRRLDTAPAYGDIEERLASLAEGLPFEIVSKIPALPSGLDEAGVAAFVTASLDRSRTRLGDALCGMLFHGPGDLSDASGAAAWEAVAIWGAVHGVRIGVSCYDPVTLAEVAARFPLEMAQLPGSALDQRIANSGAALDGIEITLRSLFLQGLLLMPEPAAIQRLPAAAAAMAEWHRWCRVTGLTPLRGALALAKGLPGVRYCVVGVDRVSQLEEIAEAWHMAAPMMADVVASEDPVVIDPRFWGVPA